MMRRARSMLDWWYEASDSLTMVPHSDTDNKVKPCCCCCQNCFRRADTAETENKDQGDGMKQHERRITLMQHLDNLRTQAGNTMPYADGPMRAELEDIEARVMDMRQQAGNPASS